LKDLNRVTRQYGTSIAGFMTNDLIRAGTEEVNRFMKNGWEAHLASNAMDHFFGDMCRLIHNLSYVNLKSC